jgi:CubicO group peptidase (beta-lactamase class C family)
VIKTAYPLPLRFAPGEKWEYCNVGYFSLAEIIRKVTGKPWVITSETLCLSRSK